MIPMKTTVNWIKCPLKELEPQQGSKTVWMKSRAEMAGREVWPALAAAFAGSLRKRRGAEDHYGHLWGPEVKSGSPEPAKVKASVSPEALCQEPCRSHPRGKK